MHMTRKAAVLSFAFLMLLAGYGESAGPPPPGSCCAVFVACPSPDDAANTCEATGGNVEVDGQCYVCTPGGSGYTCLRTPNPANICTLPTWGFTSCGTAQMGACRHRYFLGWDCLIQSTGGPCGRMSLCNDNCTGAWVAYPRL